jgi:hypothetical protein
MENVIVYISFNLLSSKLKSINKIEIIIIISILHVIIRTLHIIITLLLTYSNLHIYYLSLIFYHVSTQNISNSFINSIFSNNYI